MLIIMAYFPYHKNKINKIQFSMSGDMADFALVVFMDEKNNTKHRHLVNLALKMGFLRTG